MSRLVFSDADKSVFKGSEITHWTTENMKHCSYIQGKFPKDMGVAAKEALRVTNWNSENGESTFYDAEGLLENDLNIKVYGLHIDQGKYYWTGDIKSVKLSLNISIEE